MNIATWINTFAKTSLQAATFTAASYEYGGVLEASEAR